jgi:ribosomal protein S18 acetylase RimI-like enzyme
MDGSVIGFASLSIQHNFSQEGNILYITTMIVDERYRGQGIATALMREIEKIASERGCKRVELESAFHRKEAHAFYEKQGFKKRAYFYSMEVK